MPSVASVQQGRHLLESLDREAMSLWRAVSIVLSVPLGHRWTHHCRKDQAVQGRSPRITPTISIPFYSPQLCEAVKKLPTCRYFRDITWTITTMSAKNEHDLNSLLTTVSSPQSHSVPAHHPQMSENITRQEVKCVCPANSVAYILKHQVYKTSDGQMGYRYHFACSPETVKNK